MFSLLTLKQQLCLEIVLFVKADEKEELALFARFVPDARQKLLLTLLVLALLVLFFDLDLLTLEFIL